jgi:hypothetical protein
MIQRLQTLYFAISMILLAILLTGMDIFRFVTEKTTYAFSAFGVESRIIGSPDSKTETISSTPYYIVIIAFILFIFFALMSYKKLNFQVKLARAIFYLYLLMTIGVVIASQVCNTCVSSEEVTKELGLGFYLIVAGLPFTLLAQIGIIRDKKLLDSLNRLR